MSQTTEPASSNGGAPTIPASRYREAVKATIKKRESHGGEWHRVEPSEEEVDRFLLEAQIYGLDPLAGQIYATWEDGVMKTVTTIDGLRLLAARTGTYDGQDDPEWCDPEGRWTDFWAAEGHPIAARVRVHKKDTTVATTGTANWHDFAPTGTAGADSLWQAGEGMPAHMLSIRAEALALRKAFPAELSGLYTVEELGISSSPPPAPTAPPDIPPMPEPPPAPEEPPPAAGSPEGDGAPRPSVIVDSPAGQPSGPPALPKTRRTLAQVLESGEYERLRNDLAGALYDQMPDRLTDEQTSDLAALLGVADEAGVTAVELERICKVALRTGKDHPGARSTAIRDWIDERARRADGDPASGAAEKPEAEQADGSGSETELAGAAAEEKRLDSTDEESGASEETR